MLLKIGFGTKSTPKAELAGYHGWPITLLGESFADPSVRPHGSQTAANIGEAITNGSVGSDLTTATTTHEQSVGWPFNHRRTRVISNILTGIIRNRDYFWAERKSLLSNEFISMRLCFVFQDGSSKSVYRIQRNLSS